MQQILMSLLPVVLMIGMLYFAARAFQRKHGKEQPGPGGIRPYGVHGWLALYVFASYYLAPLYTIGSTLQSLDEVERLNPAVLSLGTWHNYKLLTWVLVALVVTLQIWVAKGLRNDWIPRSLFRARLLAFVAPWIFAISDLVLASHLLEVEPDAKVIGQYLGSIIASSVWGLYFLRSKRCRNTYLLGPKLLGDGSQVDTAIQVQQALPPERPAQRVADGSAAASLPSTEQSFRETESLSPATRISLLSFLGNPRRGLARLNGWQRIWSLITGVLLIIHLIVGATIAPRISSLTFDPARHLEKLETASKWTQDNQQRCAAAQSQYEAGQRAVDEHNALGEAQVREQRAATQTKLEASMARMFAIETSGNKYGDEWRKYSDASEAYTRLLGGQQWFPRKFVIKESLPPSTVSVLDACNANERAQLELTDQIDFNTRAAKEARGQFVGVVLATGLSFLFFSFGIYFLGWSVGWIWRGFKSSAATA